MPLPPGSSRRPSGRAPRWISRRASTGSAPDGPAGVPVVGAHGGSGATTIAAFLAHGTSSWGSGVEVYDAATLMPGTVDGPALVVTARGTAAGAAAAQRMVGALQQLHQLPVVVIVTSDGPWPLPRAVRGRLRALSGRAAVIRGRGAVKERGINRQVGDETERNGSEV